MINSAVNMKQIDDLEKVSLALVGATGIIGQEILSLLSDELFEGGQIQLSASDDSVGEVYEFRGKEIEVASSESLKIDSRSVTVLCSPKDISQALLPLLREKSLALIDCSGLERDSNELSLLPDSINSKNSGRGYSVRSACGYMINSFLSALDLSDKINSLVATVFEPVSGAGHAGLDELWNQTKAIFQQSPSDPEFFSEQIAFNLISQVDVMRHDGSTAYEHRVAEELSASKFGIAQLSITAIRVPIMYGCGVSLTMETCKKLSLEEIARVIENSPRFSWDQYNDQPPSTLTVIGDDRIHVGRVRIQHSKMKPEEGSLITCWLVADNIRACICRPIVDLYRSLMPVV